MTLLFPMPGCRIEAVTRDVPEHLHIAARGTATTAGCPDCGYPSRAVHSRYQRHPADLPSLGCSVRVGLLLRRFYCLNPVCARRTFAEHLPGLVAPYARRTRRLAISQGRVGVALGGEAAARLLPHLAMPTSADTVLRLVRAVPPPKCQSPRVVGVDDWAMRKGRAYGSVVVDLERRRVLDLLPDRTAATLAGWLQRHPNVAVVARDRSTEYARGITLGAPDAVQVADRWHLLANMRQAVERWLGSAHVRLRRLPPLPGRDAEPKAAVAFGKRTKAFSRTGADVDARTAGSERRCALYEEVQRRHLVGEPLLSISRTLRLARGTVRKYARAEAFPAHAARGPRPSIIDPHIAWLETQVTAGRGNAAALWRDLRALGFAGTARQVRWWLNEQRIGPAPNTPHRWRHPKLVDSSATDVVLAGLPMPRQLSWLLVQPARCLSKTDTATVAHVKQDQDAAVVADLARRFTELVRTSGISGSPTADARPIPELAIWLAEARACGIRPMATFAAGIEQDGAAVRAALTMPWSSGQAEGQINRLKLLKRQSYGRASLDLLRQRVLLAA